MDDLLQLYIQKYRTYFVPLTIVLVAVFLFFYVFMPQLTEISLKNSQVEEANTRIATLSKSLSTIKSADPNQLEKDITTVLKVLPDSKNILEIYEGVINSASKSDVQITTFSLKVGTVYAKAGKNSAVAAPAAANNTTSSLIASISVTGKSSDALRSFVDAMTTTLPINEITKLGFSQTDGTYDVSFYYKDIAPAIVNQIKVNPLDAKKQETLGQVEEWVNK